MTENTHGINPPSEFVRGRKNDIGSRTPRDLALQLDLKLAHLDDAKRWVDTVDAEKREVEDALAHGAYGVGTLENLELGVVVPAGPFYFVSRPAKNIQNGCENSCCSAFGARRHLVGKRYIGAAGADEDKLLLLHQTGGDPCYEAATCSRSMTGASLGSAVGSAPP